MEARIEIPEKTLREFCCRWQITELALFRSFLREDFRPTSDIDLLVRFSPDSKHTLFDMVYIQEELAGILGRQLNLVSRRGVEASRNPIRRRAVLESTKVIYEA